VFEGILVGTIDASLLRKAMQSCSGVDTSCRVRLEQQFEQDEILIRATRIEKL
jgi:hypothetical protein